MNSCDAFCREEKTDRFRAPPADMDAEGSVLSFAFLHGIADLAELDPKHFYADANAWIWKAMQALQDAAQPLDVVTVAGWLREKDRLQQVGGAVYLATLCECVPASALTHARAHAARVVEMWKRRAIIAAFEEAAAKLYCLELDSQQAWNHAKEVALAQREREV